ncbi:MAG: preprotein translocase subunit YajC [Bacteroidales bacterium]|jgi:preprotein translocase subunit YajC|nr:preprotein translocase subunit YajC [Bacteroidales bacterium]MBQ4477581.1 preprotein translocase subunit YajC [Bacteroidales bacterium]MBR4453115.1 preprotein translocase subunit YajC [Bacteroidales bacterium]MCR5555560.1 preprotein translocase subunit YajC [Bacteroidales bacterium]
MNLLNILLYASGNAQGQSTNGGLGSTLVFFGLMILVLWLFLIRPQQKRNKEEQKLRENLKKGDRIVTIGGIHGKIVEIQDTTVVIETEGSRMKIEKTAVAQNVTSTVNNDNKKVKIEEPADEK